MNRVNWHIARRGQRYRAWVTVDGCEVRHGWFGTEADAEDWCIRTAQDVEREVR